jgi:hypothetical protein
MAKFGSWIVTEVVIAGSELVSIMDPVNELRNVMVDPGFALAAIIAARSVPEPAVLPSPVFVTTSVNGIAIENESLLGDSVFPTESTLQKVIVCGPLAETVNGTV